MRPKVVLVDVHASGRLSEQEIGRCRQPLQLRNSIRVGGDQLIRIVAEELFDVA